MAESKEFQKSNKRKKGILLLSTCRFNRIQGRSSILENPILTIDSVSESPEHSKARKNTMETCEVRDSAVTNNQKHLSRKLRTRSRKKEKLWYRCQGVKEDTEANDPWTTPDHSVLDEVLFDFSRILNIPDDLIAPNKKFIEGYVNARNSCAPSGIGL